MSSVVSRMALEERPSGRATLEIVDKLKRTVELHRDINTWETFKKQEIERMEQGVPGYGKYVQTLLKEAPTEDRDRLFEFAYIAFSLPQLRNGTSAPKPDQTEERSWTQDVRLHAAVLEDWFGLWPEQNPRLMDDVVEEISAHIPDLGEYIRDYVQNLKLPNETMVNVAILAFVVSEITRARSDPSYGKEPVQVIV